MISRDSTLVVNRSMESIEQDSYSYYHLHEKIAIVSLLEQEMRKNSNEFHGTTERRFSFAYFLIIFFLFS